MKIVLTGFLFLCFFSQVSGQKLNFTYDAAGNQTTRIWICVNCPPSAALSDSLRSDKFPDISTFSLSKDFKIRLDRTAQQLTFQWDRQSRYRVDSIEMMKVDASQRFTSIKSETSSFPKIDINALEVGTYLLYVYGFGGIRREVILHKI